MACFDDENIYDELDCDCDRDHCCCLGFFCHCCCDGDKCSLKCLHHMASAICALVLALLASFSSYFWLGGNLVPSDSEPDRRWLLCDILFATYGNDSIVQPNTGVSPQACQYVAVGDLVVFFGALVLIVWFWVKARLGCGAKMELCTALLQIVLLLPMLIFAISSGIIITAGLDHTCSSNATPIQFPCSELGFPVNAFQSTSPSDFYTGMRVMWIMAWVGAGLIFLLLFPSLLSVGYTCIKHCVLSRSSKDVELGSYRQLQDRATAAVSSNIARSGQYRPIDSNIQTTATNTMQVPITSQPVSVQTKYPTSSEPLWPALGESVHLGHEMQAFEDKPMPKLSSTTDCDSPQAIKLFTLPCHYAPLFGSHRVQAHIKSIQEKHNVEIILLDQAGIPTAIQSLDKTEFESFFDKTSGDSINKVEDCLSDYLTPSSLTKFIWLWQNDQGGFSPFDPDVNATLEANYNASPEGSFNCEVRNKFGVWDYTIDFASMTQTNRKTGRKRMIKYEAVAIAWQYKNSQGKYVSHSPTHSEAIERMYINGKPVPLSIQGKTFTFNFDSMVQIGTAGPQAIHQVISSVTVPTASYELRLQVQGPSASSLDVAISDLKKELKSFLSIKNHRISGSNPILNRTVQTVLLQRARHYFVSTFVSSCKIELLGTQNQVENVMMLLQQLLLSVEKKAIQAIDVPPTWSPQTSDFALVQVNRNTSEWNQVNYLFSATLPNAQIHRLDRIQNLWLWEKYGFAKQRMAKKCIDKINEKELFHGTGTTLPNKIFRSEHGFDFRYNNQGLWGEGAYFAVNASYSDSNNAHHSAGKRQMILAKVLTGDACCLPPTDRTKHLKQPPVKTSSSRSSAEGFHEERYDTVQGNSGGSDIYVVYDHDKAYPAYLITYNQGTPGIALNTVAHPYRFTQSQQQNFGPAMPHPHPVLAPVLTSRIQPQTPTPIPNHPKVPSHPPVPAPITSQSVSVPGAPPSSEYHRPIVGESVHLDQQGIEDEPIHKPSIASSAADCDSLREVKLFTLPCHYTPLFGSLKVQARVKPIQEKHNVEFALVDQAGIPTAIRLLSKSVFDSFFVQTSGAGEDVIKKVEDCLSDYLTPSVLMKFIWLWQNDEGGFSPFDPKLNATLEAKYSATPEGSFNCRVRNKFGMWDYTIDFASMTQTNKKTGRKRMIKYEAVAIAWQYKNSQGKYVSHLPTHSEAIERMYVSGKTVSLSIEGKAFTFNFDSMVQIGTAGHQGIRRVISPVKFPAASYELRLQVQGPSASSLDVAISDLKKELEGSLCCKKHTISGSSGLQSSMTSSVNISDPILNRTVQTVLLQRARHYFVSTLISARKIELLGTHEQVDKVMLLLQQLLLEVEKQAIQAINVPPTWSSQTSDFALVQVNRNTSEWIRVTGLFFLTLPNASIHQLDRIQNLWLWEKYGFAKQRMMKKNRGNINEKELFHGTRGTHPKEIFKSEHGFDFRCANQGYWGEGAYFAVKASYSDSYAHHSPGKKQMILAKVLTGDACYLSQHETTLKQPPVKQNSSRLSAGEVFHEERYDTVHAYADGSNIHVVYDHDKAYPAYLITYQTA